MTKVLKQKKPAVETLTVSGVPHVLIHRLPPGSPIVVPFAEGLPADRVQRRKEDIEAAIDTGVLRLFPQDLQSELVEERRKAWQAWEACARLEGRLFADRALTQQDAKAVDEQQTRWDAWSTMMASFLVVARELLAQSAAPENAANASNFVTAADYALAAAQERNPPARFELPSVKRVKHALGIMGSLLGTLYYGR